MELYTLIKYALIVTLLNDGQCKIVDDVVYNLISRRIDGLMFELSKVSRQQKKFEQRLEDNQSKECACCKVQDINTGSNSSENVKYDTLAEEIMILKKGFLSEKKHQREFTEEIERKIKMQTKHVAVGAVTDLERRVNVLERGKAARGKSRELRRRVSSLERSLNSVKSTTGSKRTEKVETKITEIQDSDIENEVKKVIERDLARQRMSNELMNARVLRLERKIDAYHKNGNNLKMRVVLLEFRMTRPQDNSPEIESRLAVVERKMRNLSKCIRCS